AVVVAEDPYTAEDAAELVALDIDDRTPVLNAEDDDAPVVADLRVGFGDVQGAFRDADHVVTLDFEVGRHSAVPLEPRTLSVAYSAGTLDIYGATKVPVFNRQVLATLLGIDENAIRMHAVDAGG